MPTTTTASLTRHAAITTPIGELTLVRDQGGLTGLYFPGHWTQPDPSSFGPRVDPAHDRGFGDAIDQLGEYFAGERRSFDVTLNPAGTAMARLVWRLLGEIPYGRTVAYGALATQIGGGISPRAVGGFVGRNPLSIFIPCHRVVGSTGSLTGYAGGLERKQHLLELENAIPRSTERLW